MGYTWLQTTAYAADKVYNHMLLGDRVWIHEHSRWNHGAQRYQFMDSPLSCEEAFPDIARGELAKQGAPEWAKNE